MLSEFEAMQRIASVWDHEQVYALANAARATAAAHRIHGTAHPELRDEADRLEQMADLLKDTNRTRGQVPEMPPAQSGEPKRRPTRRSVTTDTGETTEQRERPAEHKWMTLKETADYTRRSYETVRRACVRYQDTNHREGLRCSQERSGTKYLVLPENADRWAKGHAPTG